METLTEAGNLTFADNELWRLFTMGGIILFALILGRVLKHFLTRSAPRLQERGRVLLSVAFISASRAVPFLVFSFALGIALSFLILPQNFEGLVSTIAELLIILAIGYLIYRLVDVIDSWLHRFTKSDDQSQIDDMLIPIIGKSIRVVVVILIFLQVAQTLSDQPITSILAGIGIGGLALGLAAQDSIKNFFGSMMIFADKPFDVGDLVEFGNFSGVVREVGVRSTKLNTLDGHLLTVPNGELANTTIQNIAKRPYIKRVFHVTVTYDTPPEKLTRAVELLKEILDNHEGMKEELPPQVYLEELAGESLNIVCFFWFHPPSYWDYMAFNERVNLEIFRRFTEEGIDFAFPTRTLYLAGDSQRPLDIGISGSTDSNH